MNNLAPSPDFDLDSFLPYRLAVLSERMSKGLAQIYGAEAGLSMAEWRVMVHLSRRGEVSVREIQRAANLEKSRVSRAVSRLESAGLVAKRGNREDHRLLVITLSEAGWQVLERVLPLAQAYEAQILNSLSAAERRQIGTMIARLQSAMDAAGTEVS